MPVDLITNSTNVTGMYDIFSWVQNDASGGLFFPMILFGLFIISFVVVRGYSGTSSKPFAGSAFFTMIFAIILRTLGFLSNQYMYLSITLVGIAVVWLYLENT